MTPPHVLYLHGFASSPASAKARLFAERLAPHVRSFHCPDLNQPDFSTLSVTRMLDAVARALEALPDGPVVLIGSSLGGLVALHAAAEDRRRPAAPRIDRLVLLAPALEFATRASRLARELPSAGSRRVEVFHHAYGRTVPLDVALYEDAARYDPFALALDLPVLLFQGTRDEVVHPDAAVRFARPRPNVRLRLLDDDHRLVASFDVIWRETAAFLGLDPGAPPVRSPA